MAYITFNEDLKTAAHNIASSFFTGHHALHIKGIPHAAVAATGAGAAYHVVNKANNLFQSLGGIDGVKPFSVGPVVPILAAIRIGSSLLGGKDLIDRKYFTSHWTLTDSLKTKIAQWCKQAKATAFKPKNLGIGLRSINLNQDGHELGNIHTRLATRAIGDGALTTSTTCIPIPAGKDLFYYVYPTFDATEIFDMKALKKVGEGDGDYTVVKLNQWKKEDSPKYRK